MKVKKRILRENPVQLLILIEDEGHKNCMNQIARKFKHNYSNTTVLFKKFLENRLITRKRFNKKSYHLHLTEKGKKIVYHLRKIIELIE